MKKNTLNFLVDLVTLLIMLGMVATGLVIRFVLPPGSGGRHAAPESGPGRQLTLWDMGRHDWGNIHFWLAVALAVLATIHVALHWSWICNTIRRLLIPGYASQDSSKIRNIYGFGFLAVLAALLAGFGWLAFSNVETIQGSAGHFRQNDNAVTSGEDHPGDGENNGMSHTIRGSMTLAQLESATGVPLEIIRHKLRLPDNVPPDERLGRLKHQYGFEISQIRRIVADYKDEHATTNHAK